MKEYSIGQYIDSKSIFHLSNIFLKQVHLFLSLLITFFYTDSIDLLILLIITLSNLFLSKFKFKEFIKVLKLGGIIILIPLSVNVINYKMTFLKSLIYFEFNSIYVINFFNHVLSIIILMFASAVFFKTTEIINIIKAVNKLTYFKIITQRSLDEIFMVILVTIKFIKILINDINYLKFEIKNRDINFKNIKKSLNVISNIIFSIFSNSLVKAQRISVALNLKQSNFRNLILLKQNITKFDILILTEILCLIFILI